MSTCQGYYVPPVVWPLGPIGTTAVATHPGNTGLIIDGLAGLTAPVIKPFCTPLIAGILNEKKLSCGATIVRTPLETVSSHAYVEMRDYLHKKAIR
jgi:hypothetical protein